jgi:hypothetical protein
MTKRTAVNVDDIRRTFSEIPGKRQVKNKSGRASRKQANGRATIKVVGGRASFVSAVYSSPTTKLCVVVEDKGRTFTTELGGTCSEYSSGAQRG